jgi:hypothetical protein
MNDPKIGIYRKIAKVMQECSHISKDERNTSQKYDYVTAVKVMSLVNRSLLKNGLITRIKDLNTVDIRERTFQREYGTSVMVLTTVKIVVEVIDIDTGEKMDFPGLGSGMDSGDKGVAKAQTQALKYAWLQSLSVSAGDDPEADEEMDKAIAESEHVNKPVNASRPVDELKALIKEKSIPKDQVFKLMEADYGVNSVSLLSDNQVQGLISKLQAEA